MAEFLVTGGAGFIGSHLVQYLLAKGKEVAVIDNLSTGKYAHIEPLIQKVSFFEGDIRDESVLMQAMRGVRVVFHEAAIPSVPRSVREPLAAHLSNSEGTLKVLLAARDSRVKRVVYAASSSAYGNSEVLPKVETMIPNPCSPYAASKLAGEYYCRVFSQVYGLETVILRYFNVFGPRQDAASEYAAVIPKFILALQSGKAPVIFGDGEQSRDFNYIDNVVCANLLAAEATGVSGKIFNIACGKRTSLNELLSYLQKIMNKETMPCYEPPRPGDVRHSLADISQAMEYLRYRPMVDVREGLEKTVRWFLEKP
jgi:nucleoside-diphosphate-sugar epimerase